VPAPAVLTTDAVQRPALAAALRALAVDRPLVVILCAAWCGACRDFRPAFERIARAQPAASFLWLDIEDDSELADDIDVDNFPTLAVYGPGGPLHYGVTTPIESVATRLVHTLVTSGQPVAVPAAVAVLPELLRRYVDGHAVAAAATPAATSAKQG